jgi:Caspase domain/WG containing repeat/Putative cell wall binding repeat
VLIRVIRGEQCYRFFLNIFIYLLYLFCMKNLFLQFLFTLLWAKGMAQWAIPPTKTYLEVESFSNGIARVQLEDGKWYYLRNQGATFERSQDGYSQSFMYSNGFSCFKNNQQKWQFRDVQGNLSNEYSEARSYRNGFAAVKKRLPKSKSGTELLWGFINKQDSLVLNCEYESVQDFLGNVFRVYEKGKATARLLDLNGKLHKTSFYVIGEFSDGYAYTVDKDWNMGYIQSDGTETIKPIKGRYARSFSEELAPVVDAFPNLSFIKTTGEAAFPTLRGGTVSKKLEMAEIHKLDIHRFSEGRAAVRKEGGWYYINRQGEPAWSSDSTYDEVTRFSEGLAAVKRNGSWFYIDKTGKIVKTGAYLEAMPCVEGLAWVKTMDGWGLITFKEAPVVEFYAQAYAPIAKQDVSPAGQEMPVTPDVTVIHLDYTLRARIKSPIQVRVQVSLNHQLLDTAHQKWAKDKDGWVLQQSIRLQRLGVQTITLEAISYAGTTKATQRFNCDTTIQYHALLIANQVYQSRRMKDLFYPIRDADVFANVLKSDYQFKDVVLVKNATYAQMKQAMSQFAQAHTRPNDHLLIFYAGHGDTTYGTALVPIDATDTTNEVKQPNRFTCHDLMEAVSRMSAVNQVLVIIDACYAGQFVLDGCGPKKTQMLDSLPKPKDTEVTTVPALPPKVPKMNANPPLPKIDATMNPKFVKNNPALSLNSKPKLMETKRDSTPKSNPFERPQNRDGAGGELIVKGESGTIQDSDGAGTELLTDAERNEFRPPGTPGLKGRKMLTSGHRVTVPDNSDFFAAMLKHLKQNQYLEVTAERLKVDIEPSVSADQHPQYGTLLPVQRDGGQFIFRKKI